MSHIGTRVALLLMLGALPVAQADPGNGINVGNATISPAVQLNFVADSNVARASQLLLENLDTQAEASGEAAPSAGSPGFEVKPSVNLVYKNDLARVELGYSQLARVYLLRPDYSFWNDVSLKGGAELLADRPFGLVIRDSFNFRNFPAPYVDFSPDSYNFLSDDRNLNSRTYNNLLIEGRYSPGSALDFNLGFYANNDIQHYLGQDTTDTSPPSKLELGGQGKARWRFFPRTLFLAQLDIGTGLWSNPLTCLQSQAASDGSQTSDCAAQVEKAASNGTWNFQTGIAGQITNTIQANLFVGYGGLYSDGEATDDVSGAGGLLGQFQVLYAPTQGHTFSGGYIRRFGDSALMDYIVTNSFSAGYYGLYFGNLNLGTIARLDISNYNSAIEGERDSRNDWTLSASINADYRVTPWLNVIGSFRPAYTGAYKNAESPSTFDDDTYSISQIQFSLGVRGVY